MFFKISWEHLFDSYVANTSGFETHWLSRRWKRSDLIPWDCVIRTQTTEHLRHFALKCCHYTRVEGLYWQASVFANEPRIVPQPRLFHNVQSSQGSETWLGRRFAVRRCSPSHEVRTYGPGAETARPTIQCITRFIPGVVVSSSDTLAWWVDFYLKKCCF